MEIASLGHIRWLWKFCSCYNKYHRSINSYNQTVVWKPFKEPMTVLAELHLQTGPLTCPGDKVAFKSKTFWVSAWKDLEGKPYLALSGKKWKRNAFFLATHCRLIIKEYPVSERSRIQWNTKGNNSAFFLYFFIIDIFVFQDNELNWQSNELKIWIQPLCQWTPAFCRIKGIF